MKRLESEFTRGALALRALTPPPPSEGSYVEITANFKSSGGHKSFTVIHTRLVTDSNQLTRHLLECIYSHLNATRGAMSGGGGGGGMFGAQHGHGAGAGSAYAGAPISASSGGMSEADIVLKFYQDKSNNDPDDDKGMAQTDAIVMGKARGIAAQRVQEITEKLMMDGLIYSTVDDFHFKST